VLLRYLVTAVDSANRDANIGFVVEEAQSRVIQGKNTNELCRGVHRAAIGQPGGLHISAAFAETIKVGGRNGKTSPVFKDFAQAEAGWRTRQQETIKMRNLVR
jgi:hypothetical protein